MSEKSLKRYIKHKEKRERGQLSSRKHLGLLEKKKDYRLRATDFHKKREEIRALQTLSATRNEDEYYQEMTNLEVNDQGEAIKKKKQLDSKTIKHHKDVDLKYLEGKLQQINNEMKKLQGQLASLEESDLVSREHVVFVDDEEEQDNWDACEYFDTVPEMLHRAHNRLTKDQLSRGDVFVSGQVDRPALQRAELERAKAYQLALERKRLQLKMQKAQHRLQQQRNTMSGGRYQKIVKKDIFGDEIKSKTVYKWAPERKK